jgi:hypothetical protein
MSYLVTLNGSDALLGRNVRSLGIKEIHASTTSNQTLEDRYVSIVAY